MPPVGLKPFLFPFSTVAIMVNPLYLLPKYFPSICHILSGFFFSPSPAPSLFLAFFSGTYFQMNMDLIIFMDLQCLWKKWLQLSKVVYMYKERFKFAFLLLWSLVSIGEMPVLFLRHWFFSLGSSIVTSLLYLSDIYFPIFMSDSFREKQLDFIHRN